MREVLAEVGGDQLPEIVVVNKADAADPEVLARLRAQREALRRRVSARTGAGPRRAAGRSSRDELPRPEVEVTVLVPYDRGDLVNRLHQEAEVLSEEHTGDGTRVEAKIDRHLVGDLEGFAV